MSWMPAGLSDGGFGATLAVALLWGLLGGFSHCIGMCGIFVIACGPIDETKAGRRLARQGLFQAGRMVTLAILGAAGGAAGSLVAYAAHFAKAQGWVTVVCGALLALLALGYVGIIPRFRIAEPDILGAGGGAGRKIFAGAMRNKRWYRPLALGGLVGLLPCGLTYTILLAAAATQSAMRGALALAAFGLGTIPGLLTLGMVGHLFRGIFQNPDFRVAMTRGGAVVMLLMGAVLIWRGWPNLF